MTPFTVTRTDQGCSGHMGTIPVGATAFTDVDGWVWCADAAAELAAEETRAESQCQLCAYLLHGGPVGEHAPCRDNEGCAAAANVGRPCPCLIERR